MEARPQGILASEPNVPSLFLGTQRFWCETVRSARFFGVVVSTQFLPCRCRSFIWGGKLSYQRGPFEQLQLYQQHRAGGSGAQNTEGKTSTGWLVKDQSIESIEMVNGRWVLNKQVSVWYTLILKIIRSYKNHMSILQPPLFSPWCLLAHWISAAQVVSQWWAASSHRQTSVWCPESTESLVSHYSTIIASIIIHDKLVSIIRTIEETIGTNDFLRFLGIGV